MLTDRGPGRRDFLRTAFTLLPAAMVAGCAGNDGGQQAATYVPTFFTPEEWRFIEAGVSRLIPADGSGPGALEAGVPEFIDRQMNTPYGNGGLWYMRGPFMPDAPRELGYQLQLGPREIYRLGIADANAWSRKRYGKTFDEVETDKQDMLLGEFEAGKADFDHLPSHAFFSMLLGNTREGFFSDPVHGGNRGMIGWTLIGFPGARADFMDWVERDERYPFPPVSIRGERP